MREVVILWIGIVYIGCRNQTVTVTKQDKEIISKVIDIGAFPFLPPPSLDSTDTIIPQKVIDSLLEVNLEVAIYPIMETAIEASGLEKVPNEYKELLNLDLDNIQINDVRGISSKKGHQIKLADTVELKRRKNSIRSSLLFQFSRIWYNKTKDRAVFEVGISRSHLDGNATIICMKKERGLWVVEHNVPTTIW